MDPKEGIEQVTPVDARAVGLLDPSLLWSGKDDATTAHPPREQDYCWNTGICKDICEAQTRVLLGTFSVDLLSDTEFLLYKLPKTGGGMSETELALFADLIMGSYLWAGVPAHIFVTPRTIPQARRDKVKTREYCRRITVERLAAAQARLRDLDLVACKKNELRENPLGVVGEWSERRISILPSSMERSHPGPQVQ